jgi:hypothetical protein
MHWSGDDAEGGEIIHIVNIIERAHLQAIQINRLTSSQFERFEESKLMQRRFLRFRHDKW